MGEGLGVFLAHPAFQELAAYLEVAGTGDGPDEDELRKMRELHARWTSRKPGQPDGGGVREAQPTWNAPNWHGLTCGTPAGFRM